MTPRMKNGCLICGNIDRHLMTHIETINGKERVLCNKCGAIYFTDLPTTYPAYNKDYNDHFYRPGDIYKAGVMAAKVGFFCKKNISRAKLLEVGPGNGLTMYLLKEQGLNIEGIEIDINWASWLTAHYAITTFSGPFEKHTFEKKYDLIYSSHTIEHTACPLCFFRKCQEILSNNGFLYIDTPDARYYDTSPGRWHHFQTRHPFEHICILSHTALKKLAHRTDFNIIHFETHPEYGSFQAILRKT